MAVLCFWREGNLRIVIVLWVPQRTRSGVLHASLRMTGCGPDLCTATRAQPYDQRSHGQVDSIPTQQVSISYPPSGLYEGQFPLRWVEESLNSTKETCSLGILWNSLDGRHPAPPKKPWNEYKYQQTMVSVPWLQVVMRFLDCATIDSTKSLPGSSQRLESRQHVQQRHPPIAACGPPGFPPAPWADAQLS